MQLESLTLLKAFNEFFFLSTSVACPTAKRHSTYKGQTTHKKSAIFGWFFLLKSITPKGSYQIEQKISTPSLSPLVFSMETYIILNFDISLGSSENARDINIFVDIDVTSRVTWQWFITVKPDYGITQLCFPNADMCYIWNSFLTWLHNFWYYSFFQIFSQVIPWNFYTIIIIYYMHINCNKEKII